MKFHSVAVRIVKYEKNLVEVIIGIPRNINLGCKLWPGHLVQIVFLLILPKFFFWYFQA